MTQTTPNDLSGASLCGRYRLRKKLGEGGMGEVYEAEDVTGRLCAIKIIRIEMAEQVPGALARFLVEARTSSTLSDPHVVAVLDDGIDEGWRLPFLVMPLLSGFDAESLVGRVGPLEPTTAVRIALQAARGLGAAHASRIVHRDIKPANLFLHFESDGTVTVKICDFGIAKSLENQTLQLTRTNTGLGTPLFISPEQAKNAKRVDFRTDVWSLGCTLYYLLSGIAPHEHAKSFAELMQWIFHRDPPHIQDVAPWLDPRLSAAVHGALIRDLDARCPSIEAFAGALSAFSGESEELRAEMLVGAPAELKSIEAPRAVLARRWQDIVVKAPSIPPTGAADALIGMTLGRGYRLERLLGRGGMGAVYEATRPDGARCAIKVILAHANTSPDARKRFLREARAASAIASSHVVDVLDADTDPGTGIPFIVMELLTGHDMQQLVRRVGPVEPDVVTRVFSQTCEGLSAAHASGVIHRDIKPANIFLHVLPSGEVTAKILDFGIAKQAANESLDQTKNQLTRTGGMLGSPLYMSPEQARNAKNVDARTDVWSLCMAMYEALTGAEPWPSCTTVGELILAICTEDVPRLAEAAPWVDPGLSAVVEKGLRRDLDQRWSSVLELGTALAALSGSSTDVHATELVGVSQERRSQLPRRVFNVAPTVAATSAGALVSTTAGASVRRTVSPTRRWTLGAMLALFVLLTGVVVFFAIRRQLAPRALGGSAVSAIAPDTMSAAPNVELSAEKPTPASRPLPEVRVRITPPDARVTVEGKAETLDGGMLRLHGEPGDRFKVVATAGGARAETVVIVLKGGRAEPEVIEVPRAGARAPITAAPKNPTAPASSANIAGKSSAAPPAPPQATTGTTPELQKDWK